MKRKYLEDLINWKKEENKKPLLVYGARQVGKTYLINEFGKNYYKNVIYINFESNYEVKNIFSNNLIPEELIKNLEIFFNEKIEEENTLIFFDEIQSCPEALTSLKYFCESTYQYNIIGAGSLLGVHIKKTDSSFPVGKVDFLTIYPMSFDEFLNNSGNDLLCLEIRKAFEEDKPLSTILHDKALKLYEDYLIIGGMPEVVAKYLETNSFIECIDVQNSILSSYKSDISKYASSTDSNKILSTFNSIPVQLAKDNKKFQYKLVQKGGTGNIFAESILWLINSGIVNKCVKTKSLIPLSMYEDLESFKLYMGDIGLLIYFSNFPIYLIQNVTNANVDIIGSFVENYVACSLKNNNLNLNYWQNDFTSEVDFLLQSKKGLIIPLEVKADTHVKSRSLNNYINEYKPEYSIRVSKKNFGFVNGIKSVPLYAVYCIDDKMLDSQVLSNEKTKKVISTKQ